MIQEIKREIKVFKQTPVPLNSSSVYTQASKLSQQLAAIPQPLIPQGKNIQENLHLQIVHERWKEDMSTTAKELHDVIRMKTTYIQDRERRQGQYMQSYTAGVPRLRQQNDELQRQIHQTGELFYRVGQLVEGQDSIIQDIENQCDDTLFQTEKAKGELVRYFYSLSRDRPLIIKSLLVTCLIGCFIIWTQ